MANTKKTTTKRPAEPKEIKIVVELNIPQLDIAQSLSEPIVSRMHAITAAVAGGQQPATVTIKPVQDIHIVDLKVNAIALAQDIDVSKNNTFTSSKDIFPVRPLSLFIHIVGNPNTMIEVSLKVGSTEEFKGNLFIPTSGRLKIQKNIQ